jgi:glycosyltransferase involved in cell wall biosynthesis
LFKQLVLPKLGLLHTRDYEAARLAVSNGVGVIYEDHDEDFNRSANLSESFLRSSSLIEIIAITSAVRERLIRSGADPLRVKVRGSGVGRGQIVEKPFVREFGKEDEPRKSVYCGGLHENRGIEYILQLAERYPQDRFVIVGGRNSHVRRWKAAVRSTNVEFTGYVDQADADRIQEDADILLLPYKDHEIARITSPLKFFGYMAKGRPILCSRMPEIELYQNKSLAVEWCDVGNPESFFEGYRRVRVRKWDESMLSGNTKVAYLNTWEERQRSLLQENNLIQENTGEYSLTCRFEFGTDSTNRSSRLASIYSHLPFVGQKKDWVFAMNRSAKGWVLETICKQISSRIEGTKCFVYTDSNQKFTRGLPKARRFWFAHFNQLVAALRTKSHVRNSELYVWFTHFKETRISTDELVASLNCCRLVFCTCSEVLNRLESLGVHKEILRCHIGGANPSLFQESKRLKKTVGICSGYYPRKNPNLLLEIIERMPDVNFILLAPSPQEINNGGILWSNWARYDEMIKLKNLRIYEVPYADYPHYYTMMDVFLSVSEKEGGPIPLLEAMMANVYPVVSRTGFAPDIIRSEAEGLIFDLESLKSAEGVVQLVEKGLNIQNDVRKRAVEFSWENFAKNVISSINGY